MAIPLSSELIFQRLFRTSRLGIKVRAGWPAPLPPMIVVGGAPIDPRQHGSTSTLQQADNARVRGCSTSSDLTGGKRESKDVLSCVKNPHTPKERVRLSRKPIFF